MPVDYHAEHGAEGGSRPMTFTCRVDSGSDTSIEGDGRFWARPIRSSLVAAGGEVAPDQVESLVSERADEIGASRLVLLRGSNDVEFVVNLLACLRAGSPVIVTGSEAGAERLERQFDPDLLIDPVRGLKHRRAGSGHRLHPDLALLLSTSGSTGSPRLVRLSGRNLAANAAAIADSLDLRADDQAITSLPMHYCYGLSVLTSHLAVGASVTVTDLSVVDPCFWSLLGDTGVTSLAGVPHTFDLLDRVRFDENVPSTLRRMTQAGGSMSPETVTRFARLGRDRGFQLFVMYGQTEATARMAYLPPELAESHPTAVGRAIRGGSIEIRPLPSEESARWPEGCGEVIYRGPNVMMGYASSFEELIDEPQPPELRTGDVGRYDDEGLLHIEGRRSRFAKICGLRIDLDDIERELAVRGTRALCVGDDERLVLGLIGPTRRIDDAAARELVQGLVNLPARRVAIVRLEDDPRLPSGKVDRSALWSAASSVASPPASSSVADVLAATTGARSVGRTDTFVSLGGDSLSYVEASILLEEFVDPLPAQWHLMTVEQLESMSPPGHRTRRSWVRLDTGLVLRAIAIVLIVGNHMDVFTVLGSAHVLLAVAGFNTARFMLDAPTTSPHLSRWTTTIARVAVPAMAWIAIGLAFFDRYTVGALLQVNNLIGEPTPVRMAWRYWFIEVLVQCLVVLAIVFANPTVRRLERRFPFRTAYVVASATMLVRFAPFEPDRLYWYRTHRVMWVFALGWAASRARNTAQRAAVTALAAVGCWGFFSIELRNLVLFGGILLLIWTPTIALPRPLRLVIGPLAASSLAIYLVHNDVYPAVQQVVPFPPLALVVTLVLSLAIARLIALLATVRAVGESSPGLHLRRAAREICGGGSQPDANPSSRSQILEVLSSPTRAEGEVFAPHVERQPQGVGVGPGVENLDIAGRVGGHLDLPRSQDEHPARDVADKSHGIEGEFAERTHQGRATTLRRHQRRSARRERRSEVGRPAVEVARRADLDKSTPVEERDPVGGAERLRRVMGDEQRSGPGRS